eukprot:78589-Pyramimonas_sp.AAC.2
MHPLALRPILMRTVATAPQVVAGEPRILKTFYVHNPTPFNMRVDWELFNYCRDDQPESNEQATTA